MNKIKNITQKIGLKTLEAGIFFMFASTSVAFAQDAAGGIQGGVSDAQPTGAPERLFGEDSIFQTVANILLFVLGAVAVIMLIIGGFRYVVSGGDSSAVESAKNTILYAIIGIIVAFLAFAAVSFVVDQLDAGTA